MICNKLNKKNLNICIMYKPFKELKLHKTSTKLDLHTCTGSLMSCYLIIIYYFYTLPTTVFLKNNFSVCSAIS